MNPSNNESGGLQLPPPMMEQAPPAGMPPENAQPRVEQGLAVSPEATGAAMPPAGTVPSQPITLPLPPTPLAVPTQGAVTNTTQTADSPLTDDSDLIEKEWVDKAKRIVEQNREDPYKQSEELTVVKADYMQKRFNKTIKLNK